MNVFFITGTSGTEKSTLVNYLKEALPQNQFAIHDFDEVGVPHNADKAWHVETTLIIRAHAGYLKNAGLQNKVASKKRLKVL